MEETIGDRLRRLRKSAKLTQAELASKVGLGQSAIGNIEAGMRGYGVSVVDIAKELGTTPEHLLLSDQTSTTHMQNQPLAHVNAGVAATNTIASMAEITAALSAKFEEMDASTRKLALALIGQLADNPHDHARIAAMIELSIVSKSPKAA